MKTARVSFRAGVVVVLCVASCSLFAVDAWIVVDQGNGQIGYSYPLRWGQTETIFNPLENVHTKRWGNVIDAEGNSVPDAMAFKKGGRMGVKLIWAPGEQQSNWMITACHLIDTYDNSELWNEINCGSRHGWHAPNGTHWFVDDPNIWPVWGDHNLPSYICHLRLEGDIITANPTDQFTRISDVYVVLDAPKAPMNPAWVGVLNYSCAFAHLEENWLEAAQALTSSLWFFLDYNGGFEAFTRSSNPSDPNSPENFHLKYFIDNIDFVNDGQCNDFSDFLVCMSSSVGGLSLKAQRSNLLGLGYWFRTNSIDPAGLFELPRVTDWSYHQFTIQTFPSGSNVVWDGCLSFAEGTYPSGNILGLPRDSYYYGGTQGYGLVNQYPVGFWSPAPPGGFLPALLTTPPPQ